MTAITLRVRGTYMLEAESLLEKLLESSLDVPDDRLCAGVQDADYIEAGLLEDGLALGYVLLGYGPDSPLLAWRHGLGGISEGGAPTQLDLHEDHTASVT